MKVKTGVKAGGNCVPDPVGDAWKTKNPNPGECPRE